MEGYYQRIMRNGMEASPRGLAVTQVHNTSYICYPGNIFVRDDGHSNIAIGLVEMAQMFAGIFDINAITKVAPKARLELFGQNSAYGPRIYDQMYDVLQELEHDLDTRRAVVMVMRPDEDLSEAPCTLSIQFQTERIGRFNVRSLITTVNMRSSDAVWGLPYDIIQFGGLAQAIANVLKIEPGILHMSLANAHVYKESELPAGVEYYHKGNLTLPKFETWPEYIQWGQHVNNSILLGAGIDNLFRIVKP